jgi:hypothetical protein
MLKQSPQWRDEHDDAPAEGKEDGYIKRQL